MHPTICEIGPITIYSYGLMLALAFLAASLLAAIQARKENLNPDLIIEGLLLTMADFRTNLTKEVIQEARNHFK